MNKKYFTSLADYNIWADNIATDWLNQINDEQWNQVVTSSFSSIKQTAIQIAVQKKSGSTSGEKCQIPFTYLLNLKARKMI